MKEYILLDQKVQYTNSVRDKFIIFREYLHDYVRRGEVNKLSSPLSVSWALTNQCNLTCDYCFANTLPKRTISLEEACQIVDILKSWNVLDISFEGGEPFKYPYILEILRYAKKRGFIIDILTNATLITEEISRNLSELLDSVDRIQISLGGDKEYNDKHRGDGSYNLVLNAIKKLKKVNITLNIVITKDNYGHLRLMLEDLTKLEFDGIVHFTPVIPVGRANKTIRPYIDDALAEFYQVKEKFGSRLHISGTFVGASDYVKSFPEDEKVIMQKAVYGCCGGRSKLYIRSDATIVPCGFLSNTIKSVPLFEEGENLDWKSCWPQYTRQSYNISKKMNLEKRYIEFCPAVMMGEDL